MFKEWRLEVFRNAFEARWRRNRIQLKILPGKHYFKTNNKLLYPLKLTLMVKIISRKTPNQGNFDQIFPVFWPMNDSMSICEFLIRILRTIYYQYTFRLENCHFCIPWTFFQLFEQKLQFLSLFFNLSAVQIFKTKLVKSLIFHQ